MEGNGIPWKPVGSHGSGEEGAKCRALENTDKIFLGAKEIFSNSHIIVSPVLRRTMCKPIHIHTCNTQHLIFYTNGVLESVPPPKAVLPGSQRLSLRERKALRYEG